MVAGGFTYGEIVGSVFLFFIFAAELVILYHLTFRRIKIKN